MTVELTNGFGGDGWAVAEYTFSGTNQGFFPEAPTGAPFSVRVATVFALDGDEIARSSDYYDPGAVLAQLGLLPGGGLMATPAP